jgi:hypothetical protein
MSYNSHFQVKYYNIEQELLKKCTNIGNSPFPDCPMLPFGEFKNTTNKLGSKEEDDEDEDYSEQDVLDICDKLYRDELTSVLFGDKDNVQMEEINASVLELFDTALKDTPISRMVNEIAEICYGAFLQNPHMKKDILHMIFIAMFNYQIFHVIHICISQQLNEGQIDDTLIQQCKYLTCKFICSGNQ